MTQDEQPIVGTGKYLDATELRLWTSLLDASRILDTTLEADLIANHAMTHREYEVLVRLDGWGGSLRIGELATQIEASAPLVTQTLRRLESRGLVERSRTPDDGRGVLASLTPQGRASLAAAAKPHAEQVRLLLTNPVGEHLDVVAAALGAVADHLRGHRQGNGCSVPDCPLA